MKLSKRSMTEGPMWSGIILYTIPIIFTSVLQLLFNAADLVVVGQFCGSSSVSAVGATGAIVSLIVSLFLGLSSGAGVSVAHAYGNGDDKTVHRTVHTALPISIILGAVLTVAGLIFAEPMLVLLDTPKSILELSAVYTKIYFCGMIFHMVYNFCAAILRAAGDTKGPLIYLTIAGVVNVILNLIFVTLLDMNVAGVALATVISQAVSAVLVVIALMRRSDSCRLIISKMKIYIPQLIKIIRIGIPSGIQGSMFSISNVIIQSSINSFGEVVLAGHSAAGNIEGFVNVSLVAFGQAAVNYSGQNTGAGNYKRVLRAMGICLTYSFSIGIVIGMLAYIFSPNLLSIYITDSPQAIQYGITRIAILCIPNFMIAWSDICANTTIGMGNSFIPMINSTLGICGFRILYIYTIFQIERFHKIEYLYLTYPISWLITFIAQLITLIFIYRKHTGKSIKKFKEII